MRALASGEVILGLRPGVGHVPVMILFDGPQLGLILSCERLNARTLAADHAL